MLVAGDSLAVGIAAQLPTARHDAVVGRSSRAGTAAIRRHHDQRLIVSLGANDARTDTRFRRRVRLVLEGRECVAWIAVPNRPDLTRVLRGEAERDARLHVIPVRDLPRRDGIHPAPSGYRTLAHRALRACRVV